MSERFFQCPRCGMVSHHPKDIEQGYCGQCHDWTRSSKLRVAGFYLQVENIRISLCDNPDEIALDRDGEGGHFSIREFADMLHRFISERL